MDLSQVRISELTDSVGAASRLSARFNRSMSVERVRQFVKTDRLRSFLFVDGELRQRQHGADTRGRDLLFLKSDLDAMPKPIAGYPKGKARITQDS